MLYIASSIPGGFVFLVCFFHLKWTRELGEKKKKKKKKVLVFRSLFHLEHQTHTPMRENSPRFILLVVFFFYRAEAPVMMSTSSVVMAAWRVLL